MAKGYRENRERIDAISTFGKSVGKWAGFKCEWRESKGVLWVWDYQPDMLPGMETLARKQLYLKNSGD